MIMADLKESMEAPPGSIDGHKTCIVFLYEQFRDPKPGEPGADWIADAQAHRAALRGAETAVVIANYLRLLGCGGGGAYGDQFGYRPGPGDGGGGAGPGAWAKGACAVSGAAVRCRGGDDDDGDRP